jgi:S-adenosylmethionine hydrolase
VADDPDSLSATFEGRDVFAPAAARIATGVDPERLGTPLTDPVTLSVPEPERRGNRLLGRVVYVDRFGNVITDLPGAWAPERGTVSVRTGAGERERRLRRVRTYSDLARGETGLLVSSFGLVEIGARERSAARGLRVAPGSPIALRLDASQRRARPRLRRGK